ncbi:hypothetical protein EYM_03945 [Ignicoccus islandicus DSM 13165]|uniref:UPF0179 protein EYM_03945 n=1 Tax=Ignicoccus islandicus DSM 13165 TaxID=940295 RepID=A0A0U3E1B2_9CREN|nr:UPF0179 family protein [Ignicoccus islandicus]ALU11707.1 hypothetical protein EYM_03945 [Ignicoccus islandicus DSM 13165]
MAGKKLVVPIPTHFKEGDRFIATGILPSCESCWLKEKCSVLKRGWLYEVKAKLGVIEHPCKIHGKVVVAEVEELGVPLIVPAKLALEGSIVEYTPIYCDNKKCPLWEECTGRKHKLGRRVKVRINEVIEKVECPKGYTLYKVIGIPQRVNTRLKSERRKKTF